MILVTDLTSTNY